MICGITIGKKCLVRAGAVVNEDVSDYAFVAGVPARVIGDARARLTAAQCDEAGSRWQGAHPKARHPELAEACFIAREKAARPVV